MPRLRIRRRLRSAAHLARRSAKQLVMRLAPLIAKGQAIDPDKIAVITLNGAYSCNPKYIDRQLRKSSVPHDVVWLVPSDAKAKTYPPDARVERLYSVKGIREAASARIWLDNGVMFSTYFEKRPGQVHIQTMHGSLGIKKLDNAILSREKRGRSGLRVIRRESENTDYVLTNSQFEEDAFRTVFWAHTPMLRLGHARTDILFDDDEGARAKLREELRDCYGIPTGHKLVLYAPTHRGGVSLEDLNIDYAPLREALSRRFSGEFSVMVRFHHRTKGLKLAGEPFVFNVSDYPDIQELMWVTDVGITDYSSWIYDYVLTGRPGFIYATDIDYYVGRTGFFYPLEETPFPLAKNNAELLEEVLAFDEERYAERVREFLDDKVCVDDGHAGERAVALIEDILTGGGIAHEEEAADGENGR